MKSVIFALLMLPFFTQSQTLTMKAGQRITASVGGYYEFLPPNYDANKEYDLLIASHGQGELGSGSAADLPKILNNGVARLIRDKKFTDSFIVIMPQYAKCDCDGIMIPAIIDFALSKYKAKGGKVFLTGLSLGGSPTWWGAINRPTKVHGIVPMCGLSPLNKVNNALGKIIADNKIPVLAFHNDPDPTVSVYQTKNSLISINNNKPAVVPVGVYPASRSHDVWTYASNPATKINGKNIYEWMHAITAGIPPTVPPVNPPVDPPVNPPARVLLQTIRLYSDSTYEIIKP